MSTNNSNVEKCKSCLNSYTRLLSHISRNKKCKEVYGSDFETLKIEKILATKRTYNSKNQLEIREKQAKYNKKNSEWIKDKQRNYNMR